MKNLRYFMASAALMLPFMTQAQTNVTFDTDDYTQVGVYDSWAASPFRTGVLKGNCAVVDNPYANDTLASGQKANPSAKVVGVQRSRFGSNTFGARIDLPQAQRFELTTTTKYVHVLMHRPNQGRVMLIGLGKRQNRPGQSPEAEQFWSLSSTLATDTWFDAVFPVKGNGGIDIHSLVVIPDLNSPHEYTTDFVAYVDDILVSDDSKPRIVAMEDYAVSFDRTTGYSRSDRGLNSITLAGGVDGTQNVVLEGNARKPYSFVSDNVLLAKAGETLTPTFSYSGNWMSGYVYLDTENDGKFSYDIQASGIPAEGSNLVAYSFYKNKNSQGAAVANGNVLNPPTFTLPADLPVGLYRMRYKVDWDCIDPAGNTATGNLIMNNGGAICDIMLNVHADSVLVNDANRNGEVLSGDGKKLSGIKVPFGQPLTIRMNPEKGFEHEGIILRHGYNLMGDSLVHGNPQYKSEKFSDLYFEADGVTLTIPGKYIDGDIEIEGLFVEQGTKKPAALVVYNLVEDNGQVLATTKEESKIGQPYHEPTFSITPVVHASYYDIEVMPEGVVKTTADTVNIKIATRLPFEVSPSFDQARWYTLTIGAAKYYLHDTGTETSMSLSTTSISGKNDAYLWCFVGNLISGYKLYNKQAGAGKIFSSAKTTTDGNTGGSTYLTMKAEPVATTDVTYWSLAPSSNISGAQGFYLYHADNSANAINNRNSKLAYWNSGKDAGSTLIATPAVPTGIQSVKASHIVPQGIYTLQGQRVTDPQSGLFIQGGQKVLK